MKKYIRQLGDRIELGGQVATTEMLNNGWFEYNGPLPERNPEVYEYFALDNNVIVIKTNDSQQRDLKVEEMKKYLADTDYKMTVDYFAQLTPEQQQELTEKRDAARKLIREYQNQVNNQLTA
ncbi:hypothetical protein UFOVP116_393 [uncultured Caudovirales phage]|uniref:Uncharacterized protein n=1 Tax=uncultured Caudovirales phage TaxID=2100421 RepID=A0A6J5LAJ2_9CAUD|nr:hypothetical protein UFOVP116_393 [uncultured Caudovirales phage]